MTSGNRWQSLVHVCFKAFRVGLWDGEVIFFFYHRHFSVFILSLPCDRLKGFRGLEKWERQTGFGEVNFRKGPTWVDSTVVNNIWLYNPLSLQRIGFPHLSLFLSHSVNRIHRSLFLFSDLKGCWGCDVCLPCHCLAQQSVATQCCGLNAQKVTCLQDVIFSYKGK